MSRRSPGGARRAEPERPSESELLYGVRPVLELLEAQPGRAERLFVSQQRQRGLGRLLRAARVAGVPVSRLPHEVLARRLGREVSHQGVAVQVAARSYEDASRMCQQSARRADGILVLVDRVVDPQNLGSILRSCAAAGVDGVLLSSGGGTVGITAAVARVAAGATERLAVARDPHPARRLLALRGLGFRAVALDPRGREPWDRADLTGRLVLVAGGEARGPGTAVLAACDTTVAIPLAPGVDSLNVGVAVGVLLFEAVRQRRRSGVAGLETPESR